MSWHSNCPNCHNTDDNTKIYQCVKCGKIFCSQCGNGFVFTNCPRCDSLGNKIGEIKDSTKKLLEESARENKKILEENSARLEDLLEKDRLDREFEARDREFKAWEQQLSLERELDRATEERKQITADAWKLQAESKIKAANDLIVAGLFKEAVALSMEAIKQDPATISGYLTTAHALQKANNLSEAQKYFAKAVQLLKMENYVRTPSAHQQVLEKICLFEKPEQIVQPFLETLNANFKHWPADRWCVDVGGGVKLCRTLESTGLSAYAKTILEHFLTVAFANQKISDRLDLIVALVSPFSDNSLRYYDLKDGKGKFIDELMKMKGSLVLRATKVLAKGTIEILSKPVQDYQAFCFWHALFIEINLVLGAKSPDTVFSNDIKNFSYTIRKDFFKAFIALKQGQQFSERTIFLMRRRVLENYENWKPMIIQEISEKVQKIVKAALNDDYSTWSQIGESNEPEDYRALSKRLSGEENEFKSSGRKLVSGIIGLCGAAFGFLIAWALGLSTLMEILNILVGGILAYFWMERFFKKNRINRVIEELNTKLHKEEEEILNAI